MGLTRVGPRFQVTIPKAAHDAVGLKVGDLVEARVEPSGIVLRPKMVVDKDPRVEAMLREAEADKKAGRVHGPYSSAAAAIRSLHRESAKLRRAKKRK